MASAPQRDVRVLAGASLYFARGEPPKLVRRPHVLPECDIPYYDPELDVPTSRTHSLAMFDLQAKLAPIAKELKLELLSDNGIWYIDPSSDEQKAFYPDVALVRQLDGVTAEDAAFVLEIVSTHNRRKERKDTVQQRNNNEANRVPEFALYFPDVDDARVLQLFRLDEDTGMYQLTPVVAGRIASDAIPGLAFQILPRSDWTEGHKIDVYFKGERCLSLEEERRRAEGERQRADEERRRAEGERQRADEERRRARLSMNAAVEAIIDLCEVMGIEVSEARRARLLALDAATLDDLRRTLKSSRAWPFPD